MEIQQLSHIKSSLFQAPVEQVLDIEAVVRDVLARRVAEASLARRTASAIERRQCPHAPLQTPSCTAATRMGGSGSAA